ncbi:FLYWCH-type zinc finger-containing protein 1 [Frankliniella fusca]|uniref:FLYWCH-type zinc finger-containing protein 1 n=1 Tax=Frankliniella fusca TaxID=407009 RepID=A0AAE1L7L7_9NEOP|nr:FLYWCH-type zinc finger-containing protein 1 [Frankliniella fusca]
MAEFVKSKKGGNILTHEGFTYHISNKYKDRQYWVCTRKPACKARATTRGDPPEILKADEDKHTHAPDQEIIAAKKIVKRMKQVAVNHPEKQPSVIIRDGLADVDEGVLSQMPQRPALRRTLNRKRQSDLPRNPKSLAEIRDLPDEYCMTSSGEQFLLYDSRDSESSDTDDEDEEEQEPPDRVMVFATRTNLRRLGRSDTWFLDGTFSVVALLFTQLFTIHGLVKDHAFPFVYALLTGKKETMYFKVLNVIRDKCRQFHINLPDPKTIISDFELGIINAAKAVYPDSVMRLCFFHLGQSMYRRVQEEGLQVVYNDPTDRSIKTAVHQILSLAFVPPADVPAVYDELKRELPRVVKVLGDYFEKTYIRGVRRGHGRGRARVVRGPPRYPVEEWNQHHAAAHKEARTNNLTEGWHNRFQGMMGKKHPSFYHMLREIQKEQRDTDVMVVELEMGRKIKVPQRLKYQLINARMQEIVLEYADYKEEGRLMEFLRRCGYNIAL